MNKLIIKFFVVILALTFSSSSFAQGIDAGINAAKSGDYVKAVNLMKSSINSETGYEANYYYGLSLFQTGATKQAETYLNKALKDDDEGIEALRTMGDLYSSKKDYTKADSSFAKTISDKNPNVYVGLGDAYYYRRAYPPALDNYKQALSLNPKSAGAQYGLGQVYFKRSSHF